jgi:hypothetical protein
MLRLIAVRLQMVEAASLAAFEPYNLKTNFRCRPAVGAVACHISDNHKLWDAQA